MSARAVSFLLALAISTAAGGAASGQSGSPTAAPSAAADKQKLMADADKIAERVSKLRGLKILQPIRRGVMSKPQITERLLARVRAEYKPDEIAGESLALKRLGLLPPDADYLKLVIDLLTEQIAGFYDPWARELYIADWITLGNDAIMAHEIDHALQDQHFHLRTWMTADKKNADASLARQALLEGDGLAVMIEFSSPAPVAWGQDGFIDSVAAMMSMGLGTLGDIPLVLRETLIFPYLSGVRFIAEVRKTRPWQAVDQIYRRPPLSTEHILHPSTYAAYERPVEVRPAPLPALKGYTRRYDNVLGELTLAVLLRQHRVPDPMPSIAAAGWGGDRLALFVPSGSTDPTAASSVAVLYTVWDSEVDAIEFQTSLGDALPSLSAGSESARTPDLVEYRSAAPTPLVTTVERRKNAVVLIVGAPAASAPAARAQVWKSWSVRRRSR
jgi:hypothetical protein